VPLLIFLLKERISVALQWYPHSPFVFSIFASAVTMFLLGALVTRDPLLPPPPLPQSTSPHLAYRLAPAPARVVS
jgi:hypothetical protein